MQQLVGRVRLGERTKDLVKNLVKGEIAVIAHRDIDPLAAQSLVDSKVKVVINAKPSISGKYPTVGPKILLEAKIPIIDNVGNKVFSVLHDGEEINIKDGLIFKGGQLIGQGQLLTSDLVEEKLAQTEDNLEEELNRFIDNTLSYAKKEKDLIFGVKTPELSFNLEGESVLIVVRGKNYREDLEAVSSYIRETDPVLIGVDGGADALLEYGFKPDIIIGDMDSASDEILASGAQLIVHAYPNGKAPGMKRINNLGLTAEKFSVSGTSEDVAMLLAYEKGAELIVAVGTHTTMIDFLEKGRPGMASTFLVRLKVGGVLVDAKGVSKLYKSPIKFKYIAQLLVAALFPIIVIAIVSTPFNQLIRLLFIKLRLSLGF